VQMSAVAKAMWRKFMPIPRSPYLARSLINRLVNHPPLTSQ
jgi:hypothetical protein